MKIYFAFSLLFYSCIVQAQTIYSKIPLEDIDNGKNQLEIQGLALGDSIFIADFSARKTEAPTKALWVLPSGEVVKLRSPELKNKLIVALAIAGDSTYFYYLEPHNNYVFLRAVTQNRLTGAVTTSNKKIVFTGSFVNIFHSGKKNYLLSVLQGKNQIHFSEINGMEKIKETFVAIPFDLNTSSSPFSFVSENETLSPSAAASPNKIYQEGDFIYVGIDKIKFNDGASAGTSVLKIDLKTGTLENRIIQDGSGKKFRTYIEKDCLFKVVKSRSEGAIITIYDLHTFKPRQTMYIGKGSTIAKHPAFKRDFTTTFDRESVWDAISNTSAGFITATATDSTHYSIRVGSHHTVVRSSAAGYIPMVSAFPVLSITVAVARIAAISLSDTESVDRYLYLTWDTINEPLYSDRPSGAIHVIDAYDLSLFKQNRRFEYKGYIQGASKVFGLYKESGSAFLDVISF